MRFHPRLMPPRRKSFGGLLQVGTLVCLLALPLQANQIRAQTLGAAQGVSDSAMQAIYLYNFAKFIDWPEHVFADKQSPIRICVYGEKPNDIRQAAAAIEGKVAQGREVKVRRSTTLSELGDCQMVFIPASERRWLPEVLRVAHAASALTVSDMDDFIDAGGGIGLLTIENQIRFEFNLDATQAANLKISARLLKLARVVKGSPSRN